MSALPIDGTYPSGTTKWEKRNIRRSSRSGTRRSASSAASACWSARTRVIRAKVYDRALLADAPGDFKSTPIEAARLPGHAVHPAGRTPRTAPAARCASKSARRRDKERDRHEGDQHGRRRRSCDRERANWRVLPRRCRRTTGRRRLSTMSKARSCSQPLFEFSGACAGCGETPYIKLLSQLFGDRAA